MQNLYFFTGENTFALREEKLRWIRQFADKYGEENLIRLEGPKLSFRSLLDEVSVAPFIAPKRLIIIDGVMKASKEEIKLLPASIHPDAVVVIADPKPDKRLAGTKELLSMAQTKEFKRLTGSPLQQWMRGFVQSHNSSIDTDAVHALLDMVGEDQDALEQELLKLSLHANEKAITKEDVEDMVSPTDEGVIWKLTDLLAAGRRDDALRYAHRLLERGGDAYGLWAILLNLLKNTVAIHAEVLSGNTDQKLISERSGVHFMAIRSLLPHARKVKTDQLRAMADWAVEADKALKTGGFRATDEAPEELLSLIDVFLWKYPC